MGVVTADVEAEPKVGSGHRFLDAIRGWRVFYLGVTYILVVLGVCHPCAHRSLMELRPNG